MWNLFGPQTVKPTTTRQQGCTHGQNFIIPPDLLQMKTTPTRRNWLIHLLYSRRDFDECLQVIEQQLRQHNGVCEYALYVKGLIKRQRGEINESLQLFQAAMMINPHNPSNLKQVGRSLYLLGKHANAIEVFNEALELSPEDWVSLK